MSCERHERFTIAPHWSKVLDGEMRLELVADGYTPEHKRAMCLDCGDLITWPRTWSVREGFRVEP